MFQTINQIEIKDLSRILKGGKNQFPFRLGDPWKPRSRLSGPRTRRDFMEPKVLVDQTCIDIYIYTLTITTLEILRVPRKNPVLQGSSYNNPVLQ